MPKILSSLIGPTHTFLIMIRMVRTMIVRKYMPLNLFGHQRPNPVRFRLSSRFKRIGKRRRSLLLMFLSVIGFLMNCLRMVTSDYRMLFHLPTSLNDMPIVSGITLHLMLLTIVMFFIGRYNRPLMKDNWYFLRYRLTKLLSLFIRWN